MSGAIDAQIESDVKVMQQVIVNGRAVRDRHNLSMRTPLPEVTLVHMQSSALAAVTRTSSYVSDELNVRSVKTALVSDMAHMVRFKCLPNHQLLGARFGKGYGEVQKQIKGLTHDQLSSFMASGSTEVGGNKFSSEEILVSLEYSGDKGECDVEVIEGGLVLLHIKPDGGMLDEATAREVCAKVQKMRKEAGLRKTDEVDAFYGVGGDDSMLGKVLAEQRKYVEGRIGRPMMPESAMPPQGVPLACEKKEVRVQRLVDGSIASVNETLSLTLCRACPYFNEKELAKVVPDAVVRENARTFVHYKDMSALRAQLAGSGGVLSFTLDGTAITLKQGTHFFLGSAEAAKAGAL